MDHQNHEKLISEKDGSEIAGVSAETLRQYRSIGILQGVERAGEVFYSRDELAAVFFIRPQQPAREHGFKAQNVAAANQNLTAAESASNTAPPEDVKFTTSPVAIGEHLTAMPNSTAVAGSTGITGRYDSTGSGPIDTESSISRQVAVGNTADIDPPYQQADVQGNSKPSAAAISETEKIEPKSAEQIAEEQGKSVESDRASIVAGQSPNRNAEAFATSSKTEDSSPVSNIDCSSGDTEAIDLPYPIQSISASRMPATIDPETSQLTRSLREQIEMLREERDWLRTRLEKLELRYEREQMILLSENDTVRTLISQLGKPKRKWWHALPWLKTEEQKR